MKKKTPGRTILAVTPAVNIMTAAACIIEANYEVCMAGPQNIAGELDRWLAAGDISRVLIFQETTMKDENWQKLKRLSQKGVKIELFSTLRYVQPLPETQAKSASITLHDGEDIFAALGKAYPDATRNNLLIEVCRNDNEDLIDYISYKKTRFFMSSIASDDLKDALLTLKPFCKKKFNLKALGERLEAAVRHYRESDFPFIEGKSAAISSLKAEIVEVGKHDLDVLLIGETGTGKEAAAFFLHDFSSRAGKPFVAINCAALSEELLRSELFGHVKGSFTGAVKNKEGLIKVANHGTLFLDELGDMPAPVQADLLRFLQTRKFRPVGANTEEFSDIRVIAAAQPEIIKKMSTGAFRPDLYYRIAEVELTCPALREIPDDLERVIRHLLYQIFYKQTRKQLKSTGNPTKPENRINIATQLDYYKNHLDLLKNYPWPGNVRELYNLVKLKAYIDRDVIARLKKASPTQSGSDTETLARLFSELAEIIETEKVTTCYIQAIQRKFPDLTQKQLASQLGISENTLKKHLRKIPSKSASVSKK